MLFSQFCIPAPQQSVQKPAHAAPKAFPQYDQLVDLRYRAVRLPFEDGLAGYSYPFPNASWE